jgi:acyl-coenzyme A synthetase/AMP-(fatty) acid ligase
MSTTVALDGPSPRTQASTVLAAVRAHAEASPARAALVGEAGVIGYGELWRRVHEHAAALADRWGDRPGLVRVPAVHDPDTVVALLGCWAAGGTYCPIDPAFPADHADAMVAALDGQPLDDAAYVLFTSGSTGRPKPVAVPHRALDAVIPALVDLFGITPEDRVLQYASLSWDTSFEELLPTLVAGGAVVFESDAHSGCLPLFLRAVGRRGVTVLDLPTAVWHELVLHLVESGEQLPESVRLVVIGGEAVDPTRLAAWRTLPGAGRVRLLNTYGSTETALITHAADLHGSHVIATEGAPIGRPLGHVVQHISEDGELLVAGPNLADGYPGLPDATLARFVRVGGVRWFRTGDVVRADRDGLLHHAGRLDDQVKVRGVRVDPGEVEAHLRRHPGVAAAVVTGVTLSGRTTLAAYVVPAGQWSAHGTDLVAEIREFLRARAPGHLWPSRITVVPDLARTRSGKVDRRATHDRYHSPTPKTQHGQEAIR